MTSTLYGSGTIVRVLQTFLAAAVVLSTGSAFAIERDERDSVRTARVYHIMKAEREPLEKLHARLVALPSEQLFAEFQRLAKEESSDPGSRW